MEDLAEYGSIPIINGLTDYCHPCQVLADLMTIREYKKSFDGLKFCFIGDGNNMANSLIVGAISMGMECAIACPKDYQPDAQIMAWAKENGTFTCSEDILACAKDADVVYTDVWASMGQEEEKAERERSLRTTRSTTKSWPPPNRTLWCSTACPRTEKKRLPPKCLKPMPTRSLTRQKTACTPKRPCL